MPLTLRLGRPDDADRCGMISYEAFQTIAEHHRFPPDSAAPERTVANFARRLSTPGYQSSSPSWTAILSAVMSSMSARPSSGWGPSRSTPRSKTAPLGASSMQAALQRVAERQAPGVRLVQAAYHTRSLALYATLGFEVREPLVTLQGPPLAVQSPSYAVRPATDRGSRRL